MADRPHPTETNGVRRRVLRRVVATAVIACTSVGMGSGCSMMNGIHQAVVHNDCVDEFLVGYRNRAWSAKAWHREKHRFCDRRHLSDFCEGFRQGYEDVAAGGTGCVPVIAPESYWGWRYQTPEGQAKVGAWFEGYPLGAKAAEEDGVGNWSQIRTTLPMPTVMPPPGLPMGELPLSGAPTPADPALAGESAIVGSSAATAAGEQKRAARSVAPNIGPIDVQSLTRLPASSVPTAATGR